MVHFDRRHLDEPVTQFVRRDFTPLRVGQSVGQALTFLRAQQLGERLIYFYVTDDQGKLTGVIPTRRLLAADPTTSIESLMITDVVTLPSSTSVRDACEAFLNHRFLAFPVVDGDGRLAGIVDAGLFVGEIADVTERQSVDDVFQLIGVHAVEALTPWRSFTDRLPWLTSNIAGGLLAAVLAGFYEALLEAALVIALFIPVVLALAESVSIQSVTLTLQRLHAPATSRQRFGAALRKELAAATLLGITCGTVVGVLSWMWKGQAPMALAIGSAIIVSMVSACALGVILPTTLRALQRDPKIAAGPLVLASADVLTLLFYFNLAGLLIT